MYHFNYFSSSFPGKPADGELINGSNKEAAGIVPAVTGALASCACLLLFQTIALLRFCREIVGSLKTTQSYPFPQIVINHHVLLHRGPRTGHGSRWGFWAQAARAAAGAETGVQTPLEGTTWDYSSRDPGKAGTLRPGGQLPGTRHHGPHRRGPSPADGSDFGRTNTPTPSRPAGRGDDRQDASQSLVLDREAPHPLAVPA